MAPEQFLGRPMDRRVDIYGAGVVLYQLLTGRAPFAGTTEALMYKVVNEDPMPPSMVEGADRPGWFDAIVARALAKRAEDRFASADEFRQALAAGAGPAIDDTAWEKTVMMAPPRPARAPMSPPTFAPPSVGSASSGAPPATHWDKAQLTQAELTLAKHVGPLASVLVRRAARECTDINQLYNKLAEQVSDPRARDAFLGQASLVTGGAGRTAGGTSGTPPASASKGSTGAASGTAIGGPLTDAVTDKAVALLAQHVGPIAKVLVKRAAAGIDSRAVFFNRLAEAVNDAAAREKLLKELGRLP
jgi:serine/threonine-protein kinase